jgi:hypothetical protein
MKFQLGNGHIKDKIKQIIKLWSHKEDKKQIAFVASHLWFYWYLRNDHSIQTMMKFQITPQS